MGIFPREIRRIDLYSYILFGPYFQYWFVCCITDLIDFVDFILIICDLVFDLFLPIKIIGHIRY